MSKQSIWNRLRAKGLSDTACAAVMGNMQQESALRPNNVEDRSGIPDEAYTRNVDNGNYTRWSFVADAYGYGLYQLTAADRKGKLYDLVKKRGVSIADEQAQIDLLWEELHEPMYQATLSALTSGADLRSMTGTFMRNFERPYDQSEGAVSYRTSLAQAIYDELAGTQPEPPGPEPEPVPPAPQPNVFWPPRTIDSHCTDWPEVTVAGAALYCRGYLNYAAGAWDDEVTAAVKAFQQSAFPGQPSEWDGVVGPATWGKLLERG